jgi:hypothetical protein
MPQREQRWIPSRSPSGRCLDRALHRAAIQRLGPSPYVPAAGEGGHLGGKCRHSWFLSHWAVVVQRSGSVTEHFTIREQPGTKRGEGRRGRPLGFGASGRAEDTLRKREATVLCRVSCWLL